MDQFYSDGSNSDFVVKDLFNIDQSSYPQESLSTGHSLFSPSLTDSLSSDSSDFSVNRVGRKMRNETVFLSEYSTERNSKHPKKENLRIQLYRGFLQCMKCLENNKSPNHRINLFDVEDLQACGALQELETTYRQNKNKVDCKVSLYSNPATCQGRYSSFNLAFFREALKSPAMQACFNKYIDFVFADCSPSTMKRRLNLNCCHYDAFCDPMVCMEPWEKLRDYIKEQLYEDAFCAAAVSLGSYS